MSHQEHRLAVREFHDAFNSTARLHGFWQGTPTHFSLFRAGGRYLVLQKAYLVAYCSWCWLWGAADMLLKWKITALSVAHRSARYIFRSIMPLLVQRVACTVVDMLQQLGRALQHKTGIAAALQLMNVKFGDSLHGAAGELHLRFECSGAGKKVAAVLKKALISTHSSREMSRSTQSNHCQRIAERCLNLLNLNLEEEVCAIQYKETHDKLHRPRALPGLQLLVPKALSNHLGCWATDLPGILNTEDKNEIDQRSDRAVRAMFAHEIAASLVGYYSRNYLSRVLIFVACWAMVITAKLESALNSSAHSPTVFGSLCLQLHRLALWLKGHESEHIADCLALWLDKNYIEEDCLQAHIDMRNMMQKHVCSSDSLASWHNTLGTRPSLEQRIEVLQCFYDQIREARRDYAFKG